MANTLNSKVPKRTIRVLIVDDSALVCKILKERLSREPGIEVVGTAPDAYGARDKIVQLRPDVMTLDVEMPRMNGVEFLRRLMPQYPIPVIMVSSLTKKGTRIAIESLEAGAVDFVTKPSADLGHGLENMLMELCTKIKIASTANVSHWKEKRIQLPSEQRILPVKKFKKSEEKVIAIGASTGGIEAITEIVSKFPAETPGVVVVQHMPPVFTTMFADRLNSKSAMLVKEAVNGDMIKPGLVLVAPGNKHLRVEKSGSRFQVKISEEDKVCGHRPSVEVMMQSIAKYVGANSIGIMLSGMGSDGAKGMLAMRKSGARTLAQDEATSVVYGMPKEAFQCGGAECLMPLQKIAAEVIRLLS
ncbi:MAG: chemotaxis response regulator protein-glutamate methylesterase [Deltaproteobacteria bacterium]|jgi:two-component system chemotaxis response regulator CheB|nr:MAG: chemotaxis response regulator protein-glutamate methylesterase [Deltaproteobacteria bacterium]